METTAVVLTGPKGLALQSVPLVPADAEVVIEGLIDELEALEA